MITMTRVGAVSYDLTIGGKKIQVMQFRRADDISRFLLFRAQMIAESQVNAESQKQIKLSSEPE